MSIEPQAQLTAEFPAFIGEDLLRRLVSMPDAIDASRRAFTAAARGEITGPLRSSLARQRVLIMPAEHSSGSGLIKVISVEPDGGPPGQPSIGGGVLWIDGRTGRIAAMINAGALTALRTGAASGLATALLAEPSSAVLAALGPAGRRPTRSPRSARCGPSARSGSTAGARRGARTCASGCGPRTRACR